VAERIAGIHHVTAITADAQKNIDFYSGALGLRLVKLTVNFDDPKSYHLYYGDEAGSPGTVMTFFAWPGGRRGRAGTSQVIVTAFGVPAGSLDWWADRLRQHKVEVGERRRRFDEEVLELADPDDMRLELVAPAPGGREDPRTPWTGGGVAEAHAIRGFYGVTLAEEACDETIALLTQVMRMDGLGEADGRLRYAGPAPGGVVDLVCAPEMRRGSMGTGVVHHVAFRAADEDAHVRWRGEFVARGLNVTPVIDRMYFRSIYFREPGGVLFEIATEGPGFTLDEPVESLGSSLRLPPQYEGARAQIEASLPRVRLPGGGVVPRSAAGEEGPGAP
jgi:glyoxalase family protein